MALMAYLIMSTSAPELARIWNPYDILGISEVTCNPNRRRGALGLTPQYPRTTS